MTPASVTIERLRADVAAIIEEPLDAVGVDDNLLDLGLDSMRAMNLAMQWEQDGLPIDFGDLGEAGTIAELWALVRARQEGASA